MDEGIPKNPDVELADFVFLLRSGPASSHAAAQKKLVDAVTKDNMAPFYRYLTTELPSFFPLNKNLLDSCVKSNEAELKALADKLEDARQNLGETEITETLLKQAEFYARIGDKENSLSAFKALYEKAGPLGNRLDIILTLIRIGFFWHDNDLISKNVEKANSLVTEGGDWDRRNRLRVYEGVYLMSIRNFKEASTLLLDALATFTCTELLPYKEFVGYAVLCGLMALERSDVKKKILTAPEILEVIHDLPVVESLATSLYNCQYAQFFQALAQTEQMMKTNRFLFQHYRYYVRNMRITAYNQHLESYRSLSLESMAYSFGVSEDFLDGELSALIPLSLVPCVIDKVNGIIETRKGMGSVSELKNLQYQSVIKQGDILLGRVQKLGRVINV